RVRQTNHAQANPVSTPGSHSGCAKPKQIDVIAAAAGVTRPIGTRSKLGSTTQRKRNERQNNSSPSGTSAASPKRRTGRNAQRAVGERTDGSNDVRLPSIGNLG